MEDKVKKVKESLSVVFPAYNEEANIGQTLSRAIKTLPIFTDEWEIIVVNDGSIDKTMKVLEEYKKTHPNVIPIHHPSNKGYGAALKSGITSAQKDLIFFCDSDLQFDLQEIGKLLHWIDRYDIVAGYRVKRQDSFHRRLNAYGWNMLVRILLGLNVKDIDCAFKLFKRAVFDKVKIDAVGAMVNTDILAQAINYGFKLKEVPVSHFPRLRGKQTGANIKVILRAFKELIRLYKKLKLN